MSNRSIAPGAPIPHEDRVKPAWLADDEMVYCLGEWRRASMRRWKGPLTYRLPEDHRYYILARYNEEHRTDFAYNPGREENAPEDWDGDEVLFADGSTADEVPCICWKHVGDYRDIIGYTREASEKPAAPEETFANIRSSLLELQNSLPLMFMIGTSEEHGPDHPVAKANHALQAIRTSLSDAIFAAENAHLPADTEESQPWDERTVRAIVAHLAGNGFPATAGEVTDNFLPKPDPVEKLAKLIEDCDGSDYTDLARWLIENGVTVP